MLRLPAVSTSRPLRVALFAALAGLAAPAGAHAEGSALIGITSSAVDVAMTSDGAAHLAWLSGPDNRTLAVCRIPAGSSTCTGTGTRTLPDDPTGGPWVLARGTTVVVAAGNRNGAAERTSAFLSTNSGASYGALASVAPISATDVDLSPSGTRLWVSSGGGLDITPYARFASAPLPAGVGTGKVILQNEMGGRSVDQQLIGVRPDGRPLVLLSGSGPNLPSDKSQFYYSFNGALGANDATNDTALHSKPNWSAATPFDLPDPNQRNGNYEVASGAGQLWFGYEGLSNDIQLRKWNGSAFGAGVNPDCTTGFRFAAGAQDAPALALTPGGRLQVAWTGSNGGALRLGYAISSPDGSTFSPYQEIDTGAAGDQRDVELASDPSVEGGGIAVWTTSAIGSGGQVKFARLPAGTPAACPPPATTPVVTPVTVPGGSTTPKGASPISLPNPPTTTPTSPVKKKRPSITSVVRGLPSTKKCVSRRSFTIRLRQPNGARISSARVRVNGRTVATRKGKRVKARIDLKGLPKGRYTVKITVKLTDGRTVTGTRRYRTCVPKRR